MRVHIEIAAGAQAGRSFQFEGPAALLIGRSPQAQLCLEAGPEIGLYHALLEVTSGRLTLRDLGGPGGAFLDEQQAPPSGVEVSDGARIRVGQVVLRVQIEPDAEEPAGPAASSTVQSFELGATETLSPPSRGPGSRRGGGWAAVLCLRCGEEGSERLSPADIDSAVYFCPTCRAEMTREPVVLPGYQVIRRLGQGAMGVVDLARHEQLGLCVLKRMLPQVALSERNRRMFIREASQQARVKHPNVVELLDFQEPQPGVFVAVLEYVDGENADKLRERAPGGRLPPAVATELVAQALLGLSFMHQRGVVHRDLKEENLLVRSSPAGAIVGVKIADFGLAKNYEEGGSSLTGAGEVAGTVPYMAPEHIAAYRTIGPPADLYAMGVVLYRLLTGAYPHDFPPGRHPFSVILLDPVIPPRRREPSLPEALVRVIERAMDKEPEHRFPSADAMREALLSAR